MFQSKNLFNSAANFALSNMAFTIFSVAESVDQSNLLAIQTSHWQVSNVCIKPLKPSCGIIDFAPICQPVLHPKRLSFLEIQLRIICASRHIYLSASDHMYSSSLSHSDKIFITYNYDTWVWCDWIICGSKRVYFANIDIHGKYQLKAGFS